MAIEEREYLCAIDTFKKPVVVEEKKATAVRLLELIMMEPGSNPLHPDMGVGVRNYRYGIETLEDLEERIREQIETYLPMCQLDNIAIIRTPDKVLNVEIEIKGIVYSFGPNDMGNPVVLDDIQYG